MIYKKEYSPPLPENPKIDYVRATFYITYVLLLTTGTITFIEAIRTPIPEIRHIMNIETCISIVASYFYSQFTNYLDKVETQKIAFDYKYLSRTRYIDWFITTPLMLLGLCLFFVYNIGTSLKLSNYGLILLLNFSMLYLGYLGENGTITKLNATIYGFIVFILLYGLLYYIFIHHKKNFYNILVYGLFFIVWSLYGIVYNLEEDNKNIFYNVLDSIAKCFIGIFLWAYFTNIFKI